MGESEEEIIEGKLVEGKKRDGKRRGREKGVQIPGGKMKEIEVRRRKEEGK